MIGNEHGVGANRPHDLRPQRDFSAAALDGHPLAIGNRMLLCQLRMNLDARLGILLDERTNPARLRAGEELADDASRGQYHGKLGIDIFRRRTILSDVEARFAVGKIKRPRAARDRIPRIRLK